MPDPATLLGKILVTTGYTWGLALGSLLLGALTAKLAGGPGAGAFYHPLDLFLDAVVLSLLVSLLAASAGVLISLRVATVRQAQQILAVGTIVLVFGGLFVISVLPPACSPRGATPSFCSRSWRCWSCWTRSCWAPRWSASNAPA